MFKKAKKMKEPDEKRKKPIILRESNKRLENGIQIFVQDILIDDGPRKPKRRS